jgi:RND family efflux transporter MFP subunit
VVAPQTEVKLAFKTGGIIEQTFAKEGQTVSRGQLLAKLNMSEIEAQVAQARISLQKADRDLQRAKNLYKDSVTTLEQLQNATTGQEISVSSLKIAEFNQKYSTIYAPITGRVVRQFAEAGELIGVGNPVFMLASAEQAYVVKVGLTDREVVRVKLGDTAEITMDAHAQKKFRGFISQIAQIASPATGTYEVEIQIDNPENLTLIAGFIAKATIQPRDSQNYTVVPTSALVEADGENGFIYTIKGEEAQKVPVKILLITSKGIAIETNLPTDSRIVVEGAGYLTDKIKVKELK